jgi:hypothetical protein
MYSKTSMGCRIVKTVFINVELDTFTCSCFHKNNMNAKTGFGLLQPTIESSLYRLLFPWGKSCHPPPSSAVATALLGSCLINYGSNSTFYLLPVPHANLTNLTSLRGLRNNLRYRLECCTMHYVTRIKRV